jgi:hypothetical protein
MGYLIFYIGYPNFKHTKIAISMKRRLLGTNIIKAKQMSKVENITHLIQLERYS